MELLIWTVLCALGAWGGARLIAIDTIADGPRNWLLNRWPVEGMVLDDADLTEAVLDAEDDELGMWHGVLIMNRNGRYMVAEDTFFGALISCVHCSGVWVSFAAANAWWWLLDGGRPINLIDLPLFMEDVLGLGAATLGFRAVVSYIGSR